jgi:uroporphyrinogen-III synthase
VTSVLVTRPSGQADGLCERITALGHEPVHVPAIEIAEPEDSGALAAFINRLDQCDLVVLVSVNAVHMGLAKILQQRDWPQHTKLAAVGPSSTAAVDALGLGVDYVPEHEFSSEGLLALPALQDMQGKQVAILRGNGGRNTLSETLTARGAQVEYLAVYRRVCPQGLAEQLQQLLQDHALGVITATSNESLQNLYDMAGSAGQPLLRDIPLVVASRRQAALAAQLGFTQGAVIAGHASDEAMAEGVKQLFSRRGAEARRKE